MLYELHHLNVCTLAGSRTRRAELLVMGFLASRFVSYNAHTIK